ncbi:DUF4174 domain-containing protein [Rubrimonas cliftonensis]|nr:DUF4174 domain-containing protein [Rubrimonas cliftonensis]
MLAGLTICAAAELGPEGLDALRWEARPVVVIADPDDPRLAEQLALFEADAADMIERRNVVIVDTAPGSALRRRFGADGFLVALIGLDGGVKLRSDAVTPPGRLEALIDAMPMRRREMRRGD